jgi:tetrapyrrole methylase family protein / MazG family protein
MGYPHPHIEKQPESLPEWFEALFQMARYLRGPQGCPWDRKQTSKNFADFLREEAAELDEAFANDDNTHIEEEFGDTFFNMLACAAAAEEEGRFTLQNALERIHEKMIRRHDHVFGEQTAKTPEDAIAVWNAIKDREKQGE